MAPAFKVESGRLFKGSERKRGKTVIRVCCRKMFTFILFFLKEAFRLDQFGITWVWCLFAVCLFLCVSFCFSREGTLCGFVCPWTHSEDDAGLKVKDLPASVPGNTTLWVLCPKYLVSMENLFCGALGGTANWHCRVYLALRLTPVRKE